ncbi:unnamed protein product, partial [Prorocentrum cordatum]
DPARPTENAGVLKQLGDCSDPAVVKARVELQMERDGIRAKVVRSKPYAGRLHNFTARTDELEKQRAHRQELLDKCWAQKEELETSIDKVEKVLADLPPDIQELDTQRWQ